MGVYIKFILTLKDIGKDHLLPASIHALTMKLIYEIDIIKPLQ